MSQVDYAVGEPGGPIAALRPEARTLGLTLEDMALQARAAFFGAEAVRVQRGREEVRVYLRLPATERNAITDIESYLVRTPSGAEVPLSQVALVTMGTSPPAIRRQDSQRVVTVTADVDADVISAGEANAILEDSILGRLTTANPDLTYSRPRGDTATLARVTAVQLCSWAKFLAVGPWRSDRLRSAWIGAEPRYDGIGCLTRLTRNLNPLFGLNLGTGLSFSL